MLCFPPSIAQDIGAVRTRVKGGEFQTEILPQPCLTNSVVALPNIWTCW
jgi:hypothetical protein